ncbi:MAG: DsbA oxidoreductase [Parcubacteria group bacterium GW2011_GWA1_51_12]|nr:MAG: DsbA oxidoreductase [Parcubacteria group bacterium GW2011_GWA1_51_12]
METEASGAKENSSSNSLLVPGAIIAAGALVALAVIYSGGGTSRPPKGAGDLAAPAVNNQTANENIADDDPFLGNPEAPVTVVEFSDFQCPFCGRFYKNVEPRLLDEYVKTGKVRFVYRDFAFLGDESTWAAEAAECADEQGKFWEYHNYLFERQNGENQGAFSKVNLKSFAKAVGLEGSKFDQCFDGGKYTAEVEKDLADARALGVNATPTSFINGVKVTGAVPYESFKVSIEEALANAAKE